MSIYQAQVDLYISIWLNIMFFIAILTAMVLNTRSQEQLTEDKGRSHIWLALLVCIAYALFWGSRGFHGFGDTTNYVINYTNATVPTLLQKLDWEYEPGWMWFNILCKSLKVTPRNWLYIIDFIQILVLLIALIRMFGKNTWFALVFFLASFEFYAAAFNGLRIGISSSVLLLAFSCIQRQSIKSYLWAVVWIAVAWSFHQSQTITITALLLSWMIIRSTSLTVVIWAVCVVCSFLLGRFMDDFLLSLDNDKLTTYIEMDENAGNFSRVGFRWDFLLFSLSALLYGWWIVKKKTHDIFYRILVNTYILTNAFWVLVIQTAYSNRFAALSWFLMPLVFCYPVLRLKISIRQGHQAALLLVGLAAFTYILYLIRGH